MATTRKRSERDPLEERISPDLKQLVEVAQQNDEAAYLVAAFVNDQVPGDLGQEGADLTTKQPEHLPVKPAAPGGAITGLSDASDVYQRFLLCLGRTNRKQVNVRLIPEVAEILKTMTEFLQQVSGRPREIDNGMVLSLLLLTMDGCLTALQWQDRIQAYKARNPRQPDGAFWAMADLMMDLIQRIAQDRSAGNADNAKDEAAASQQ